MPLDFDYWLAHPKIDMHCHVWRMDDPADEARSAEALIAAGDMLGISEYWCSSPVIGGRLANPDEVRAENDAVLRAMRISAATLRNIPLRLVAPGAAGSVWATARPGSAGGPSPSGRPDVLIEPLRAGGVAGAAEVEAIQHDPLNGAQEPPAQSAPTGQLE